MARHGKPWGPAHRRQPISRHQHGSEDLPVHFSVLRLVDWVCTILRTTLWIANDQHVRSFIATIGMMVANIGSYFL